MCTKYMYTYRNYSIGFQYAFENENPGTSYTGSSITQECDWREQWFTDISFANECQDDLAIFKSMLECFSYTFTHRIYHKMPRNLQENAKKCCRKLNRSMCPSYLQNIPCFFFLFTSQPSLRGLLAQKVCVCMWCGNKGVCRKEKIAKKRKRRWSVCMLVVQREIK